MNKKNNNTLSSVADRVIATANELTLFRVHYRPYWLMSDLACISSLIYAWVFARHFPSVSNLALTLALLISLFVYKIVREVKASIGIVAARSFLQDCLMVIIPSFLLVMALLRQPLNLALAYLGTVMPLYGSLVRIGCFLGGCCYGKRSSSGVLYPDSLFKPNSCSWRRYSPSPNPGSRVFPIQLLEASAQAVLFIGLLTFVWTVPGSASFIFWLYLLLYASVRFALDFFRTTSARRRYWKFSEAQLTCIALSFVSSTVLLVHR